MAVPSPLSVKLTPPGRAPVSVSDAAGYPDEVTVKVPAVPSVKVVQPLKSRRGRRLRSG